MHYVLTHDDTGYSLVFCQETGLARLHAEMRLLQKESDLTILHEGSMHLSDIAYGCNVMCSRNPKLWKLLGAVEDAERTGELNVEALEAMLR